MIPQQRLYVQGIHTQNESGSQSAIISPCGSYRYRLDRHWGDPASNAILVFLMLNPSTADASVDDPTIRRCISFAKREKCDGLTVVNLYALRSPDPKALRTHIDPVAYNDSYLREIADEQAAIVCAWGVNADPQRVCQVTALFRDAGCFLACLGTTKDGHPRHPLYVRGDQPLVTWAGPAA